MTTTHRITTGIVVALGLAASAVPASARPFDVNANGTYVSAGPVTGLNSTPRGVAIELSQAQRAGAAVRPNPDQQVSRTSNHGGAAQGHTVGFRGCPRVGACISPYRVAIDGSPATAAHQTTATSQQPFQWGDAGIGAGAILVLLGAGSGAAVATRRQRHRVTAS